MALFFKRDVRPRRRNVSFVPKTLCGESEVLLRHRHDISPAFGFSPCFFPLFPDDHPKNCELFQPLVSKFLVPPAAPKRSDRVCKRREKGAPENVMCASRTRSVPCSARVSCFEGFRRRERREVARFFQVALPRVLFRRRSRFPASHRGRTLSRLVSTMPSLFSSFPLILLCDAASRFSYKPTSPERTATIVSLPSISSFPPVLSNTSFPFSRHLFVSIATGVHFAPSVSSCSAAYENREHRELRSDYRRQRHTDDAHLENNHNFSRKEYTQNHFVATRNRGKTTEEKKTRVVPT